MDKMLRMCLNWKVLAGLALVAVGVGVYRPDLLGAALPILLLAACPLSMLLMMRTMGHRDGGGGNGQTSALPDDPATLRTRMNALAAEQERVSEKLVRLNAPSSPDGDGSQMGSPPSDRP